MCDSAHPAVPDLVAAYGGSIWNQHPIFKVDEWMSQVANKNTRSSYCEWCYGEIQAAHSALGF